ncbi:hypothetical protein [Hyphomicrobium sp. DY-1]|uniref:hypothetical protein n=1 Tax=Hyphomicrobium sp. DY-1 TaxID=3075650 RepID=UPI0039C03B2D
MKQDRDEFDMVGGFTSALAALNQPPKRAGQTLKGRRAEEHKKLSPADRRALQVTGRTDQLNVRLRPMTVVEFKQTAAGQSILISELFERAWEHYKATVGI